MKKTLLALTILATAALNAETVAYWKFGLDAQGHTNLTDSVGGVTLAYKNGVGRFAPDEEITIVNPDPSDKTDYQPLTVTGALDRRFKSGDADTTLYTTTADNAIIGCLGDSTGFTLECYFKYDDNSAWTAQQAGWMFGTYRATCEQNYAGLRFGIGEWASATQTPTPRWFYGARGYLENTGSFDDSVGKYPNDGRNFCDVSKLHKDGTWHHFAMVRSFPTVDAQKVSRFTYYIDGAQVAQTDSTNFFETCNAPVTQVLAYGGGFNASQTFPGLLGPMRLSRGPLAVEDFLCTTPSPEKMYLKEWSVYNKEGKFVEDGISNLYTQGTITYDKDWNYGGSVGWNRHTWFASEGSRLDYTGVVSGRNGATTQIRWWRFWGPGEVHLYNTNSYEGLTYLGTVAGGTNLYGNAACCRVYLEPGATLGGKGGLAYVRVGIKDGGLHLNGNTIDQDVIVAVNDGKWANYPLGFFVAPNTTNVVNGSFSTATPSIVRLGIEGNITFNGGMDLTGKKTVDEEKHCVTGDESAVDYQECVLFTDKKSGFVRVAEKPVIARHLTAKIGTLELAAAGNEFHGKGLELADKAKLVTTAAGAIFATNDAAHASAVKMVAGTTWDLAGCDQSLNTLYATGGEVTSRAAATLTVVADALSDYGAAAATNAAAFTDNASFCKAGALDYTLTASSTSRGTLTVAEGRLNLAGQWAGDLAIASGATLNVANAKALAYNATVRVAYGATLAVDPTVTPAPVCGRILVEDSQGEWKSVKSLNGVETSGWGGGNFWIAGGADDRVSTAANWEDPALDMTSGEENAIFAKDGTHATIAEGDALKVKGIEWRASGFTLEAEEGADPIELGDTGFRICTGVKDSFIKSDILLTADQTWTSEASIGRPVTISGHIGGDATLTIGQDYGGFDFKDAVLDVPVVACRYIAGSNIVFNGSYTVNPGSQARVEGTDIAFRGGISVPKNTAGSDGDLELRGVRIEEEPIVAETWVKGDFTLAATGNLLSRCGEGAVTCAVPYALDEYAGGTQRVDYATLDLAGFDQRVNRADGIVTSRDFAQLHIRPMEDFESSTLKFQRAAGLVKEGAATVTLRGVSSSCGDLTVQEGTLVLAAATEKNPDRIGAWPGVRRVTVEGGELRLENDQAIGVSARLAITGGQVTLKDGVQYTVRGLVVGGTALPRGIYGGPDSSAPNKPMVGGAYVFAGTGTVKNNPEGLMFIIRGPDEEPGEEEPLLRLGVLSDIHVNAHQDKPDIGCYPGHDGTFVHALRYLNTNNVDGVVIAGDLTNDGLTNGLAVVAADWRQEFPDDRAADGRHVERFFIYGNHDGNKGFFEQCLPGMLNRAPYKDVDTAETLRARAISYQPKAAFENWFGEPWDYVQVKKCKDYAVLMVNDYAISDTYSLIGSDAKMRALVNEHLDEIAAAKGKVICVSHVTSGLLDAYPQTLYVHGHTHNSPYVTSHKAGYFDVETGSLAWTGASSGSQKKENWKRYVWIFEFFKDRVEARLHQFGNQYVTAEPDETETLPPQE